jgi:hypothetical protein
VEENGNNANNLGCILVSFCIKSAVLSGLFILFCTGSSSFAGDNPGFHWLKNASASRMASGIQWNEQYMVTAKHVDFLSVPGVTCAESCDLQFVRQHQDISTTWRSAKHLEPVRVVGVAPGKGLIEYRGRVLPWMQSMPGSKVKYQMVDAQIEDGMSGGPVYGEDGAVLGMVVGFIDPTALKASDQFKGFEQIGLFLPTVEIERQWVLLGLEDEPEGGCDDGDCD